MTGYRDPVPVMISERDANTLRLALVNYQRMKREAGHPPNDLAQEAREIADRLLRNAGAVRDKMSKL